MGMKIEALSRVEALRWMPESLITKYKYGFGPDSLVRDGSDLTIKLIDELALLTGPMLEKVYTLYASGVTDHEGKTFSPEQIISMVVHNNPYRPKDICRWTGGVLTESGIVYGPSREKKQGLLEDLCCVLDEWNPLKFKSLRLSVFDDGEIREKTSNSVTDKELSIYLVANYAQFVFLVIHPFWNRNGRTSEELMQLFCAQNQARKLVFWQNDGTRYNVASDTRMKLVNRLAQELLTGVLDNLGVSVTTDKAVTEGYREYFLSEDPNFATRLALSIMSPYHYRFISDFLSPQQSARYFAAMERKIRIMVDKLKPDSFASLLGDKDAKKLLRHHLAHGRHFEKA